MKRHPKAVRTLLWVVGILTVFGVGAVVVAGIDDSGIELASPMDVFSIAGGHSALAEPPPTDLAEYLPSGEKGAEMTAGGPAESILIGDIVDAERAFGIKNVDGPSLGEAISLDDVAERDFEVFALTVDVTASSSTDSENVCVLVVATDSRVTESHFEDLVPDSSEVWFPVSPMKEYFSESGGLPELEEARKSGCVSLTDGAVLVPSPDGASIERIGPWEASIDTFRGVPLGDLASDADDLAGLARP